MYQHYFKILKIAHRISSSNPFLGYELEKATRLSVMNPGARTLHEEIEDMVFLLKSLRVELENLSVGAQDIGPDKLVGEFNNAVKPEEQELGELLTQSLKKRKASSSHLAGPFDFLKNVFKKPVKDLVTEVEGPGDKTLPDDMTSYGLSDYETDEFVNSGKWDKPSAYVEKEKIENDEFFDYVNSILNMVDDVRKNPSPSLLDDLIEDIKKATFFGTRILKREKPGSEKLLGRKPQAPAGPSKTNFKNKVNSHLKKIQNSSSDEEFFENLRSFVEEVKDSV
jgi:hypothetical protein